MGRYYPKKREAFSYRPTEAVATKLKEVTHGGLKESYSSYTARIMAEHFGLPDFEPDIQPAPQHQQTLPMRDASETKEKSPAAKRGSF